MRSYDADEMDRAAVAHSLETDVIGDDPDDIMDAMMDGYFGEAARAVVERGCPFCGEKRHEARWSEPSGVFWCEGCGRRWRAHGTQWRGDVLTRCDECFYDGENGEVHVVNEDGSRRVSTKGDDGKWTCRDIGFSLYVWGGDDEGRGKEKGAGGQSVTYEDDEIHDIPPAWDVDPDAFDMRQAPGAVCPYCGSKEVDDIVGGEITQGTGHRNGRWRSACEECRRSWNRDPDGSSAYPSLIFRNLTWRRNGRTGSQSVLLPRLRDWVDVGHALVVLDQSPTDRGWRDPISAGDAAWLAGTRPADVSQACRTGELTAAKWADAGCGSWWIMNADLEKWIEKRSGHSGGIRDGREAAGSAVD